MYKKLLKNKNWIVKSVLITLAFFVSNNYSHAATIGKPNNYLLQSGLVGWWTFDANEMSPNVRDRSGQGNHAYLVGQTSTSTASGKLGQALNFDGVNDRASTTINSSLDLQGAMTVCGWGYLRTVPNASEAVIISNISNATSKSQYSLEVEANRSVALFWNDDGSFPNLITGANAISFNRWYYLCAVRNSSSAGTIYIDGVAQSTTVVSGAVATSNVGPPTIGRNGDSNGSYWNGLIDDVRIYNRALSASEISALYKLGGSKVAGTPTAGSTSLGGLNAGLIGWWTFDVSDVNWQSGAISNRASSTYPAYLFGMSTTTSPRSGHSGQSLYFDGSSSFARTELIDNTHFISALDQPHSMFAWVYRSATTSNMSIVSYGEFDDLSLSTGIGIIGGKFAWLRNGVTTYTLSPFDVPVDRWTFVGVVRTSGSLTTFYMNASSTVVSGSISSAVAASDPFTIGSAYRNGAREGNFLGRIDDVRVYNRNVSSVEAQQLYVIGATKLGVSAPTGSSLSSGLVGHWTFDAPDMIPNVRDRSGQGNHGNLIGQTATTASVGKIGQALSFDGVDDYINIPANSSLNVTNYTISFWLYKNNDLCAVSGFRDYLSKDDGNTFYVGEQCASPRRYFGHSPSQEVSVGGKFPVARWVHVSGTFDSSNNTINFYQDGVLIGSGNTFTTDPPSTDSLTRIGAWSSAVPESFIFGKMDDIRIYNRALSASEIRQLYNMSR